MQLCAVAVYILPLLPVSSLGCELDVLLFQPEAVEQILPALRLLVKDVRHWLHKHAAATQLPEKTNERAGVYVRAEEAGCTSQAA